MGIRESFLGQIINFLSWKPGHLSSPSWSLHSQLIMADGKAAEEGRGCGRWEDKVKFKQCILWSTEACHTVARGPHLDE